MRIYVTSKLSKFLVGKIFLSYSWHQSSLLPWPCLQHPGPGTRLRAPPAPSQGHPWTWSSCRAVPGSPKSWAFPSRSKRWQGLCVSPSSVFRAGTLACLPFPRVRPGMSLSPCRRSRRALAPLVCVFAPGRRRGGLGSGHQQPSEVISQRQLPF